MTSSRAERSRAFRSLGGSRFWWHRLEDTDYVPSIYAALTDTEWSVLEDWYDETEAAQYVGEINVPAMSLIHGLVSGSGVRRIVQLGHFYGYSTLVLGFLLRAMNATPGLASIDIDPAATAFTNRWVEQAELSDYVSLLVGDSAAEASVQWATSRLGGSPQLILVDSSHTYAHTLRELDLWTPQLPLGGIMMLHDTSRLSQAWDTTEEGGGVFRALDEWLPQHPDVAALSLNTFSNWGDDANALTYKDGCGLGILQKIR